MTTDAVLYEASISAAPYARDAHDHLIDYLVGVLTGVVSEHVIPLGAEHLTERVVDHDVTTVRIRFNAVGQPEASAITAEAAAKIGSTDEHWSIVGEPTVVPLEGTR